MLRIGLVLAIYLFSLVKGAADTPDICDTAAIAAAQKALIPQNVMLAVTRIETGRSSAGKVRPWPWMANVSGDVRYFESRSALLQYLQRSLNNGTRNFDAGCFQINYRWHGHAFRTVDEMVDPQANAHYAAILLNNLYAETNDWAIAVGLYHTRTSKHAARYVRKFSELQDTMRIAVPRLPPLSRSPALRPSEDNTFALLLTGAGFTAPLIASAGQNLVE